MAKAKTINLLLEDGTLDGLITMADSQWNSGELYSVPRAQAETILSSDAVKKFGVYLLLSQDMVYVGQASDLSRRIKQHIIGKDWWERVIVLTTTDDSLNRSDIDYLESVLIQKAAENNRLDSDNKNKGNKQKVTKFREVELQQYLEEALFLLKLIGIDVFDQTRKSLIASVPKTNAGAVANRTKREAKLFLEENNIHINKKFTFAKKQPDKDYFWANPQTFLLEESWNIVLNNQDSGEMYVLLVPASKLKLDDGNNNGLHIRSDKPYYVDLRIDTKTFIDKFSGIDFKPFIINKIQY